MSVYPRSRHHQSSADIHLIAKPIRDSFERRSALTLSRPMFRVALLAIGSIANYRCTEADLFAVNTLAGSADKIASIYHKTVNMGPEWKVYTT